MTAAPHRVHPRAGLHRRVAAWSCAFACLAAGAQAAQDPLTDPAAALDHMAQVMSQGNDNPRAALQREREADAAPDMLPVARFWRQLIQARLHGLLEQEPEATAALQRAREALAGWPDAGRLPALALALQELQVATLSQDTSQLRSRMQRLRDDIRATGNARLTCDALQLHAFVLTESSELAPAWQAAKEAEVCAAALGDVELQATAIVQAGMVASKAVERTDGGKAPGVHYARALQVLGDRPARYLRSIIEWELGKAQLDDSHSELMHYERARELSRQIGDDIGVAVADIDIGLIKLAFKQPQEALQLARQARATLLRHGAQARVMATYSISIGALTQLNSREVLREIADARRWELPATSPATRAYLARQMARGYAAAGDYRHAYDEQSRSDQLAAQGRKEASNREVLHLQARFEAAQRDAENARLKLRDESARLQLEAERARQQRLWAALAAVGVALLAAVGIAWRNLRQRRQLADLASRDELTGAPNRRAVMAIARSQWAHCRRLHMPLAVAMVDLDHFKRVNDTWGHDAGDRVLRAFADAAAATLRSQDRLGRYGGEEWLLVSPGASAADLQAIFRRLRERFAAMPIEGMPQPHGLSFSMGGAPDHPGCASIDTLITEADQRLYRAKNEGRDRLCAID